MDISKSIFTLTKYNNGFFKSEKQAAFLTSVLSEKCGVVASANSSWNQCPISATWDTKGIITLVKESKRGDVVTFERKIEGQLTCLEIKRLESLERRLKSVKKAIADKQASFESGNYNGSGDRSTYTADMIERFHYCRNLDAREVSLIEERISELKSV